MHGNERLEVEFKVITLRKSFPIFEEQKIIEESPPSLSSFFSLYRDFKGYGRLK
jgi:hypothetical protein